MAALILGAGVAVGCSPAWLHNRLVAHEPVFLSAHGGINLYIGNNPIANGYTRIPPGMMAGQAGMLRDSISIAEKEAGRPLRRHEVSAFWADKAKAWVRENPADWLRLMSVKVRNLFHQFQYDDLTLLPLFAQAGIATPGIRFGLVAALAIPAIFMAVPRSPRLGWVLAAALLHMAALLSVFVTERYRLAAAPGLLILAACGLVLLWEALVDRRWRFAGVYAAAAAVSAAFVAWPVNDPSLWALDYVNLGVKASRVGELDLAERNLRIGLAFVPTNAEGNFALGNVFLARGDLERAAERFERTVQLEPRHDGAWNNLGFVALKKGQPSLARLRFERSLAIDPEDAKTWYLLAQALEGEGDQAAALHAARRALSLQPGQAEIQAMVERLAP